MNTQTKQTAGILTLLLVASLVSSSLIIARFAITGYLAYYFLVWNLFLAWIPLGIAWFTRLTRPPLLIFVGLLALWGLFFPNAPYIMTDLVHLRPRAELFWLDLGLILSFALTGLFVGYLSLAWMQALVRERWGQVTGWLFAVSAVGLSGVGVYIGRFLRWNSWDLFTRPDHLSMDLLNQLNDPYTAAHAAILSLIFAGLFLFGYIMMTALPQQLVIREA